MSEAKKIYRGRIVNLRVEPVTLPNGNEIQLELMDHPGASAVVALDEEGTVVLIRQYRHAASGYLWEIPAGTLDAGEEPERCAYRELEEEAGLRAGRMEKLGAIFTAPGFCNEVIHLYLAQYLQKTETRHGRDEVITEVRRVPLGEALEMIARDEIRDAKTAVGLFRAAQLTGA